jgi:molybdopterin converting factor small subunit
MEIAVKLMGLLRDKAPPQGKIQIPEGATIADIPADSVQVFTVNGKLERNQQRPLAGGDELTILPPVGGG